ncbi:DUF2125 domain-containing protein [Lutimaribacter marinistellae]|uniref:DUF2125 domain-containing protein n=1 Tax=Lutimaribacter marinistellae TaxID=1820329 RepID=A0ABV7T9A0_9RHOB
MSVFFRRTCGAAFIYAIATQGAWADLTADQVWADWQSYMAGMGYEVTGQQSKSGDTTTISDIAMAMDLPEEDGQFSLTWPEMTLTENSDGTVTLGFPENFPMVIAGEAEGETFRAELAYDQQGLSMVVSGSPEDMTYEYSADTVGVRLVSIEADGETLPAEAAEIGFNMTGMEGVSRMQVGEQRKVEQTFAATQMAYVMAINDPEGEGDVDIRGTLDGMAFEGGGIIPVGTTAGDYQSMIEAGFDFSGDFSFAAGQTAMSGVSTEDGMESSFALNSASQGGAVSVAMNGEQLAYDVSQNATQIAVQSSDLPFPVEMAMSEFGLALDIPVQKAEEPQPFAMSINLTDFTMSDMIWQMFDPAGQLPRDPATVLLDLSGMATVLVNMFDPAVAETLEATGAAPGQLDSVTINELLVSLLGARLEGTGEFAFDNTNTEEFGGMPAPSGQANLTLAGANALLDKLIGMGFMSQEDAMGARMMMGMLAVPGDAPDTLKSTIEITADGQILANGQRIK